MFYSQTSFLLRYLCLQDHVLFLSNRVADLLKQPAPVASSPLKAGWGTVMSTASASVAWAGPRDCAGAAQPPGVRKGRGLRPGWCGPCHGVVARLCAGSRTARPRSPVVESPALRRPQLRSSNCLQLLRHLVRLLQGERAA